MEEEEKRRKTWEVVEAGGRKRKKVLSSSLYRKKKEKRRKKVMVATVSEEKRRSEDDLSSRPEISSGENSEVKAGGRNRVDKARSTYRHFKSSLLVYCNRYCSSYIFCIELGLVGRWPNFPSVQVSHLTVS